ncbi:tRNA guanosine(34) transglycosylase Tgt [archaeon]|nr:tRNA guanosine(34) transglycosylase Tgt [archaeon]
MFKLLSISGNARYGKLKTGHGIIETPCFMPVATKAVGKFIASDDYISIGAQAIISNAFLLSLNPGTEAIKKAGNLHKFMGFKGPIFTDCGAFQMIKGQLLNSTSERGIIFNHPHTNLPLLLTPKEIMTIQNDLGSDIAMALDCLLPFGRKKEEYALALKLTHKWMEESKSSHNNSRQLLFGITQGGTFLDLRRKSAQFINSLNFDGNAIGGLAIGEPKKATYSIIRESSKILNKNKPRYVMGLGHPLQLLNAIELGIDIFDSIYPAKNARHGMLFTFNGTLNIRKSIYKTDKKPIEEDCFCPTCKLFSRAYLRYLCKNEETAGKRLMSIHNLRFMQRLMQTARQAIKENNFKKFKKEICARF